MSRPARAEAVRVAAGDDKRDLGSLIDWSELRRRGWDSDREVFAPSAEDPVFGFARCASASCDQIVHHPGLGLCRRCQTRWELSPPGMRLEEFCQRAPARTKPVGGGLCLVCRTAGHERPVRGGGLCTACMAGDAVGQVAVPFGICQEPTNVKAHGQACPFRHQCFGCTHFRTDPSYLPELHTLLRRLLADDERLRAAAPELQEWARHAAIPAGEEIAAVRQLIDRCETVLAELPEVERAATNDAIAVLRRSRAQLDATVPVRFLGVIGPPAPRLFPNVVRDQETTGEG